MQFIPGLEGFGAPQHNFASDNSSHALIPYYAPRSTPSAATVPPNHGYSGSYGGASHGLKVAPYPTRSVSRAQQLICRSEQSESAKDSDRSRAASFRVLHPKFPQQVPTHLSISEFRSLETLCVCKGDGCSKTAIGKTKNRAKSWKAHTGISDVPKEFRLSKHQKRVLDTQLTAAILINPSKKAIRNFRVAIVGGERPNSKNYYGLVTLGQHLQAVEPYTHHNSVGLFAESDSVSASRTAESKHMLGQFAINQPQEASQPFIHPARAVLMAESDNGADDLSKQDEMEPDQLAHRKITGANCVPIGDTARIDLDESGSTLSLLPANALQLAAEPVIYPVHTELMARVGGDVDNSVEESKDECSQFTLSSNNGVSCVSVQSIACPAEVRPQDNLLLDWETSVESSTAWSDCVPLTVDEMIDQEAKKATRLCDHSHTLDPLAIVESRSTEPVFRSLEMRPIASQYFESLSDDASGGEPAALQYGAQQDITGPDAINSSSSTILIPSALARLSADRKRQSSEAFRDADRRVPSAKRVNYSKQLTLHAADRANESEFASGLDSYHPSSALEIDHYAPSDSWRPSKKIDSYRPLAAKDRNGSVHESLSDFSPNRACSNDRLHFPGEQIQLETIIRQITKIDKQLKDASKAMDDLKEKMGLLMEKRPDMGGKNELTAAGAAKTMEEIRTETFYQRLNNFQRASNLRRIVASDSGRLTPPHDDNLGRYRSTSDAGPRLSYD